MPGRFAQTVGLDDSFEIFFLGRIPTLARLQCRAGAAGEASMPTLDGRVLEASQVEYKPFGKPPLQREIQGMQGFPAVSLH